MKTEKFLEKLIRLTLVNGFMLPFYEAFEFSKIESYSGGYLLQIEDEERPRDSIEYERIIFDHDFIRVLCELAWENLTEDQKFYFDRLENLERKTLGELVQSTDRPQYLLKTFGELIDED